MARQGGLGDWGRNMRDQSAEQNPTRGAAAEAGRGFPGSNMPGNASPGASDPPAPPPYRFGSQVRQAWGQARQQWRDEGGFKGLAMEMGNTPTKVDWNAALAAAHPAAPAAWESTKWAFRGNRTTDAHSLYGEQNLYGGVQRDAMPTGRISTWDRAGETGTQARAERRRGVMNAEELYPSNQQPGMQQGEMPGGLPPSMGDVPTAGFAYLGGQDPLFAKNTGAVPYNQNQFGSVHQRATAGGQ